MVPADPITVLLGSYRKIPIISAGQYEFLVGLFSGKLIYGAEGFIIGGSFCVSKWVGHLTIKTA